MEEPLGFRLAHLNSKLNIQYRYWSQPKKISKVCTYASNSRIRRYLCKIGINELGSGYMGKSPERRDLFAGALELVILHSLSVQPMRGYALVKHIKMVSDDLLQVEEGSLYPVLQRMLREAYWNQKKVFWPKAAPPGFTG